MMRDDMGRSKTIKQKHQKREVFFLHQQGHLEDDDAWVHNAMNEAGSKLKTEERTTQGGRKG